MQTISKSNPQPQPWVAKSVINAKNVRKWHAKSKLSNQTTFWSFLLNSEAFKDSTHADLQWVRDYKDRAEHNVSWKHRENQRVCGEQLAQIVSE